MWPARALRGLVLAAVLLLPAASAANALPHLTGKESNFTLTDMSAMLEYTPAASGPIDTAWNQTYSTASWAEYTPVYPVDDAEDNSPAVSAHRTRYAGAAVRLPFLGTAVYFFGTAKGKIALEVGGQTTQVDVDASQAQLLASATGLQNVMQDAKLVLVSGEMTLNSVIVTLQLGGEGATITNSTYYSYEETATAYFPSPNITWSQETGDREWVANASMGGTYQTATVSSGSRDWSVPRIQTNVPHASFILHPPDNTSFVSLTTVASEDQGPFTVTIDPPLFDGPATTSYTQGNPWLSKNLVNMFFTPLDFRKKYTVTVTFTGTENQYLELVGGRFITTSGGKMDQPNGTASANGTDSDGSPTGGTSSSGSSKSSTPIGAIVGGVVGGFVVLVALGLLIFFCCRRKKRASRDGVAAVQTQRAGKPGRFRRPPSALSDFGTDAEAEKPFIVDESEASLNRQDSHVTPLVVGAGPSGITAAQSKAYEAGLSPAVYPPSASHSAGPSSPAQSHASSPYATPSSSYASSTHAQGQNQPGQFTTSAVSSPLSQAHPHAPYFFPPQQEGYHDPNVAGPIQHSSAPSAVMYDTFGASPPAHGNGYAHVYPPSAAPHPHLPVHHEHEGVSQEVDAGRLPQPVPAKESIPPQYNPMWAQEDGRV